MGLSDMVKTLRQIKGDGGGIFRIGRKPDVLRLFGPRMVKRGVQQPFADACAVVTRLDIECGYFDVRAPAYRRLAVV